MMIIMMLELEVSQSPSTVAEMVCQFPREVNRLWFICTSTELNVFSTYYNLR